MSHSSEAEDNILEDLYHAIKHNDVDTVDTILSDLTDIKRRTLDFLDSLVGQAIRYRSADVLKTILLKYNALGDNFQGYNLQYVRYREDLKALGLLLYKDEDYFYNLNTPTNN